MEDRGSKVGKGGNSGLALSYTRSSESPNWDPETGKKERVTRGLQLVTAQGLTANSSPLWLYAISTEVPEKTLESPLDTKEIKPVTPEGNQPWIFTGKTETEAEAPVLWPPDGKIGLLGKDLDPGIDWGQEEKGTTEDEMVGWHHRLHEHEFE